MDQLEHDKQAYIDYILAVAEECGADSVLNGVLHLKRLSLKELDALSRHAEKLYETHFQNKALEDILEDIHANGIEHVKKKHGIK